MSVYPKPDKPVEDMEPTCPDTNGAMPSCAPLAVPYVPFQRRGAQKYDHSAALENGTLFPGLNLPFKLKAKAANVPMTPLGELQALEFVLVELGLYLDTHADDAQAMELYRQYAALEKEGRARYEQMYGPVTQPAAAQSKTWSWLSDPWPWNYQEGGDK